MGILDLFRGSKDERIAKRLMSEFRAQGDKRRMEFVADDQMVVIFAADGKRDGIQNLANLKHQLESSPASLHDGIYQRFVQVQLDLSLSQPTSYADARSKLFIALRDVAYGERTHLLRLNALDNSAPKPMLSRPFAGDVAAFPVLDRELGLDYVAEDMLEGWGVSVDQVMEDAFVNTRNMRFTAESAQSLLFIKGPDAYNVSCMACEDAIRALPVKGFPVAAPATRDSLSITGSDDLPGLELLAQIFEAELSGGNRHVSGRPLVLTPMGWQSFEPPEALRDRFLNIARRYDVQFWSDYKEMLEKHLAGNNEDIFVASLSLFERSADKSMFTAVVWSAGVDTILPPADHVYFYDEESGGKREASWEDVTRVMGSDMQEMDGAPRRYRVREFPTDSQFLEMAAKKV